MVKLKQTKLKHRKHKDSDNSDRDKSDRDNSDRDNSDRDNSDNHTTKKYKILTSKNKNKLVLKKGRYYRKNDSINKKHKRSKKYFNIRTLDALKKYGSTLKNQDGGFIISYLKFQWNMRKIKQIIDKLGKNQVEINKYIDSFKKQPETFKRLGDKKAAIIYDILRTQKEKTIIEFLLENGDKEKTYDTSNMEHDLNMIKTKIEISITNQLMQINAEIDKEKPKLKKNLEKFKKDSIKFEKINEDYSKIMAFYVEQKELSDKYHAIEKDEKLTDEDKKIKKKYKKNEENIKYILSKDQLDINVINDNIKKIATLMNMSNDYNTKFKDLIEDKYKDNLQKWQNNYKDIYVNIINIEGGIKLVTDTLNKIKEYVLKIGYSLKSIYNAINQNIELNPILKIEQIINENLGYMKNIKEVSLKKVKYAFIEQIPIVDIEYYLPLSAASIIQTETSMNELNTSLILDKEYISTGRLSGGGNMKGSVGELEWFGKGGATAIPYEDLLKLTIDKFLDTDYKDIFETLKQINDDITDTASDIYSDLTITQILNIMKIYFNIYMFLLYYKTRDGVSYDTSNTQFVYNDNISALIKIIKFFEIIEKKFTKFNEITNTMKGQFNNLKAQFNLIHGEITLVTHIIRAHFTKNPAVLTHIWNPFMDISKEDSIKNLYYTYNPYDDARDSTNHLKCITAFFGYYNKKLTDPYNEKDKCSVNEKTILEKNTLHNEYRNEDLLLIYDDNINNKHVFVSIYYDKDNIEPTKINYKKIPQFAEIKNKYNDLVDFMINGPNRIQPFNPPKNQDQLKKFKEKMKDDIYNANKNLHTTKINEELFCMNTSNDKFETIINKTLNNAPYNSQISGLDNSNEQKLWAISFMKNRMIENDWRNANYFTNNSNINDKRTTIKLRLLELTKLYAQLTIDAFDIGTPANIASREIISFVSILVQDINVRTAIIASDNDLNAVIESIKKAEAEVRHAGGPINIANLGAVAGVAGVNINTNIQAPLIVPGLAAATIAVAPAIQMVISTAIGTGGLAINSVDNVNGIAAPILTELVKSIENNKDKLKNIAEIYENNNDLRNSVDLWRTILPNANPVVAGLKIETSVISGDPEDKKRTDIQSILLQESIDPVPLQQRTFYQFLNNGTDISLLIKNIIPLLLKNIYNNFNFNYPIEGYHPLNTLLPANAIVKTPILDPTLLPLKILKVDNNDKDSKFIVLYKCDGTNDEILTNYIKTSDKMQKYYFTWLTSKCNSDTPLQTDNMSNLIVKLYENKSLSSLNLATLNLDELDKNPFINSFEKDDKKIFLTGINGKVTDVQLDVTKYSITIDDDKNIYNNSLPILREEPRLAFDLPHYTKINEYLNYPDKKTFTDFKEIIPLTKLTNKKGDYKNIPIQFIKRIVSFNVNNWNRSVNKVDQIKPKPDSKQELLTNPKNAIDFIKKYLPETDVLGFLNYSLYSNEATSLKHIQSRLKPLAPFTNINPYDIKVDNKTMTDYISNELKLENYIIKNDNYDRAIRLPILTDDDHMFLGKALYYNDKNTPIINQITLPKINPNPDSILYSQLNIHTKPIGLYLVNTYSSIDKGIFRTLIKNIEDNKAKNGGIEEIVIMGSFLLDGAYTRDQLIEDMKTEYYNQFGKIKDTCINSKTIDLCFVSDDFAKQFTILNDDIVVPSGSVSSHYPIYLDIIENQDIDIEDSDFITILSQENIVIKDGWKKITFNLTLKKKPMVGGSKSKPKAKYTPKIFKITGDGTYNIEMVDSDDNVITDDRYKIATIDKITNIITIKDKNGKTSMIIDKASRKITRFEDDGTTIESTSVIDTEGTFITTDKSGREYKTKYDTDGKPETKDISTGDYVKSHYEEAKEELDEAKVKGKLLLSKFVDYAKKENLTMLDKDKENIISNIRKINELIKNKLKPKSYENIKLKIDALAKNIIELQTVEPELTPDKVIIKEYSQKARSYDWMEDVTKREKTSITLQDEAKELQEIIHKHPKIKDILPSSYDKITENEIRAIFLAIDPKTKKMTTMNESIQKSFNKLKSKENADIFIHFLKYQESNEYNKCVYLEIIHKYTSLPKYFEEYSNKFKSFTDDCSNIIAKNVGKKIDELKRPYVPPTSSY